MSTLISYWFYPLIALSSTLFAWLSFTGGHDLQQAYVVFAGLRFLTFMLVEWQWPARSKWGMSWASFKRDVKYMLAGGALLQAAKFTSGWLAIGFTGTGHGAISPWPLALQVLAAVLTYELVQYWLHRLSHEARGPIGRFLWRVHAVHHLPRRIYFLMHPVMHPLNMLLTIAIGLIPAYVLGVSSEAVFLFNLLLVIQGLMSHFNAPIKAGPINYLLVGTELHRLHHSANLSESGNYGVLTPVWDMLFGSFIYKPDHQPAQLGVYAPDEYPSSNEFWLCLSLPFRTGRHTYPDNDEP